MNSGRSIATAFAASSPRRRIITTCILLFLVSTFIPYQFAYLDAVLVQMSTCTRALRLVRASVRLLPSHDVSNVNQPTAFRRTYQLLQLHPLYPNSHALGPSHQYARAYCLGAQPCGSLAHALRVTPQCIIHNALPHPCRNLDVWQNGPPPHFKD